jgi:hypothetical protein
VNSPVYSNHEAEKGREGSHTRLDGPSLGNQQSPNYHGDPTVPRFQELAFSHCDSRSPDYDNDHKAPSEFTVNRPIEKFEEDSDDDEPLNY